MASIATLLIVLASAASGLAEVLRGVPAAGSPAANASGAVALASVAALGAEARSAVLGFPDFVRAKRNQSAEPLRFVEVTLGPFASAAEACQYCFGSFTKQGAPPAGPVAPFCVCMAFPGNGGHEMFCATPPAAAGYVGGKGGCRCVEKDTEQMGATTCKAIQ
eukprot:CAMPEP_0171200034 /NCGR_PEP_ID=MMETSP0790-20130122/23773_1 /TAXON_ID=2925 /ORGANISM="Alexandrium catenella, Strain OF101" /LENGTH=162 /DNA_ID=CAMNT_0011665403 /DNA_START=57 /DNA_END=545 /DNA_ORIENTATION=-